MRNPGLDGPRPLDDRRHAYTPFVEILLESPQVPGGVGVDSQVLPIIDIGESAIVAGEPDEGVVRDSEVLKSCRRVSMERSKADQFAELQGPILSVRSR